MKKTYFKKTMKILLCTCLVMMSCLSSSNSILATSTLSALTLPNIGLNSSKSLYDVRNSLFDITLESASNLTASLGEEIEITLGIQTPSLGEESEFEVLFLVDTSFNLRENSDHPGSQNLNEAIKWATYKFASNFKNQANIKIGFITYNSDAILNIQLSSVKENNFLDAIQSVMEHVPTNSSHSNLKKALELANTTFSTGSHIKKQIVLLSNEHQIVSNSMEDTINSLKSKDVELHTFGISQDSHQSFTSLQSFHNKYTDNNSSRFHEVPGGAIWNLEKSYFPTIVENIKYSPIYGANITSYEMIFLMDASSYMNRTEYKEAAMWSLVKLAKNYYDNPNVRIGFITYGDEAISVVDPIVANYSSFELPVVNHIRNYSFNSNTINIRDALKLANEKFSDDPSVYRQIVLVGHDSNLEFNVTDENYSSCGTSTPSDICIVQSLQNKQVDLFTYTMGTANNLSSSNGKATLREVHNKLCNSSERYYYELYSYNDNYYILEKKHFIELADLTKQLMGSDTTIGEIELDLNNNFILVNQNSNKISVQIAYGKKISISFKVKAIQIGQLNFGDSYLNVNGQRFKLTLPTIYIEDKVPDTPSNPVPPNIELNGNIRILEIQPGDSFKLQGQSNLLSTGIDTYIYQEQTIVIEHITMPEFIGKIEQLNGYYDVIVIGNNSSWDKKYSQINLLSNNNNDYNENDITERKADEIIKFIESGQLVYIDESILTDYNLKQSNLYKKFNSISADNFKKFSSWELGNQSSLSINKIISEYLDDTIKKSPKFSITKFPNSDSQESDTGQIINRFMEFELDIPEEAEGYSLNLYLDINGDGLYREDEIVKVIEQVTASSTYQFSYEMDPYFVGQIDWKIELTSRLNNKDEAIKSYSLGSTYFKNTSQTKLPIKVLQVYSYREYQDAQNDQQNRNNEASNLLLSSEKFQNIVNEQQDYEIIVTEVPASKFNVCAGRERCTYKNQEQEGIILNGTYDMLIFGFGDYPADISDTTALNEIKAYISSGQSVMFTHDNFGDKELLDWLKATTGFSSHIFSDDLRVFVGQSRFKRSNNEIIKNLYQSYNSLIGGYDNLEIPLLSIGDKIDAIQGLSTARSSLAHTNKVYKTNESLITTYPFKIGNIDVAQTHRQYFQLNLEDADVVPWLNLSQNGNSGYDSKNEYYTYSKGTITFSGTGHSNGYTDDELRLFVNTIVKAGRGANHAPTIESSLDFITGTGDAATGIKQIEVTPDQDFYFNTIVRDIDGDDVTVTITINDKVYFSQTVSQGTKIDTTIPDDSVIANQPIMIKLEAKDKNGAQAVTKNYQLNPVSTNQPTLSFTSPNLYYNVLAGDLIKVELEFEKLFDDNVEFEIVGATLNDTTSALKIVSEGTLQGGESEKILLTYEVVPLGTMENVTISGKLNYRISGADKSIDFSFIVNARSGSVTIKLIDENGNPYKYAATAKLSNEKTDWEPVVLDALGMSEYTWNNKEDKYLNSSNYQLELELPNGYEIKSIKEDNTIVSESFSLNYDNPTINRVYTIGLASDVDTTNNLIHGLDEGIRDGQLQVTEGTVKLIPGSHANILARICILHKQEPIYLNIDKNFIDSDALVEKIKVYKWENDSLVEISDVSVNYIEGDGNQAVYAINFSNTTISNVTDIVIKYPVQLNSSTNSYVNNVIYTIDGNRLQKEFRIDIADLPDLF